MDHDIREKNEDTYLKTFENCVRSKTFGCFGECTAKCMMDEMGFSRPCANCMGASADCGFDNCKWTCLASSGEKCEKCLIEECRPAFIKCSGFSFPNKSLMAISKIMPSPKQKPSPKPKKK